MFLNKKITFNGVKGIGALCLNLSNEKMNVLTGTNGIGKTKALEALYTLLLFTNTDFLAHFPSYRYIEAQNLIFTGCEIDDEEIIGLSESSIPIEQVIGSDKFKHHLPVVYPAVQNRGKITTAGGLGSIRPLGEFEERKKEYFESIWYGMGRDFSSPDMDTAIEEWFIQRANSANPYQESTDNREVELLSVLRTLNKLDARISAQPEDFRMPGGKTVSLLLDGEHRRLNELSSGFSSLIGIVQSIIAGYACFTNDCQLELVEGYVLIDEREHQ